MMNASPPAADLRLARHALVLVARPLWRTSDSALMLDAAAERGLGRGPAAGKTRTSRFCAARSLADRIAGWRPVRRGRGEGLFRQDFDKPGLLRRPKRLLDQTVFRRLEADHRSRLPGPAPRGQGQQPTGSALPVHCHSQGQEGAGGRINLFGASTRFDGWPSGKSRPIDPW